MRAFDLGVLVGVGSVALARCNPVADDAWPEHEAEKLIFPSVPEENDGAGAAATVQLLNLVPRARPQRHFVLQYAGGPQQADDVRRARRAEAGADFGWALPEISRGAGNLPLLPLRSGEYFDLCTESALAVVRALERKAQPVVLVAADVAQKHGRPAVLRDKQVHRAI